MLNTVTWRVETIRREDDGFVLAGSQGGLRPASGPALCADKA